MMHDCVIELLRKSNQRRNALHKEVWETKKAARHPRVADFAYLYHLLPEGGPWSLGEIETVFESITEDFEQVQYILRRLRKRKWLRYGDKFATWEQHPSYSAASNAPTELLYYLSGVNYNKGTHMKEYAKHMGVHRDTGKKYLSILADNGYVKLVDCQIDGALRAYLTSTGRYERSWYFSTN